MSVVYSILYAVSVLCFYRKVASLYEYTIYTAWVKNNTFIYISLIGLVLSLSLLELETEIQIQNRRLVSE